jgi:hypothetical protein
MRIHTIRTAILVSVALGAGIGQVRGATWRTFTDSRECNCLVVHDSTIWAGTSGGVTSVGLDGEDLFVYTNSEGLGGNQITSCDAAGGYLWFGSATGRLSRFDPSTGGWTVFVLEDRDGNAIRINDMAHSAGYLWIATDIGIGKFDIFRHGGEIKETYRRLGVLTVEIEVISVAVVDGLVVALSPDGLAWASVDDQLLQDPSHWSNVTVNNSDGFPEISFRDVSRIDNRFIVGTVSGVYVVTESEGSHVWTIAGLSGRLINELRSVSSTEVWITAVDSLSTFDGTSIHGLDIEGVPEAVFRTSVIADGQPVIGSNEGVLIRVAPEQWLTIMQPGPPSNSIVDIDGDKEGDIWILTETTKVGRFDGLDWQHYDIPHSSGGNLSLAVDNSGSAWIGTHQNGALKLSGDELVKYDTTNSSFLSVEDINNYVVIYDIDIASDGILWFACHLTVPYRSVCFYDPGSDTWGFYDHLNGLDAHEVQAIHVIDDAVWTGYENSGLFLTEFGDDPFDNSDVVSRQFSMNGPINYNLPSDNITVISSVQHPAAENDLERSIIWVGTNAGLAYYDEPIDRFRRIELPVGIGPQVNALESDPFENLWVGTSHGLLMIPSDGSTMESYLTENSGIAGDEVTSLYYDVNDFLWIGTTSGLSRLDFNASLFTEEVADVVAYPNPFLIPDHDQVLFTYKGVAELRIFTLAGELVAEREISNTRGWDGRNDAGELVAGGLYLFHIRTADGDSHSGKLAVIRK